MKRRKRVRIPGDLSRRNSILVALVGWKACPFRTLSEIYKKTIAEGLTGPRLFGRALEKEIGRETKIGCARLPMDLLCLQVMNDPDRRNDFLSFEDYHRFYLAHERKRMKPLPRNRLWPIILSGKKRERETILDGWHRFHSYYRSGVRYVPAIWYA